MRLTRRGEIVKAAITALILTTIVGAFLAVVAVTLSLYMLSTGAPK